MDKPADVGGDDDTVMTAAEVGDRLKVDPKTITRWAKEGRIPEWSHFQLPGGHLRVWRNALRYIMNGKGGEQT